MGRYTGPKARINRRLGAVVFETAGAMRAFENKNYPPGQHIRRKKSSIYGEALTEKQKIKYYYGLREKQLRKYFEKAKRTKANTGEVLLVLCENRVDNAVRRAGFTKTRMQARQGVVHGHFQLNGRTIDKPSIQLKPGDIITVKNRPNLIKLYSELVQASQQEPCEFLSVDTKELRAIVTARPTIHDVTLPVGVGQVVAFLSR